MNPFERRTFAEKLQVKEKARSEHNPTSKRKG
jgi:hypothetical protein